jgi:phosphatidylserine/phosphatidylglycerophosphate/cardiolipin synthase-like enzyme
MDLQRGAATLLLAVGLVLTGTAVPAAADIDDYEIIEPFAPAPEPVVPTNQAYFNDPQGVQYPAYAIHDQLANLIGNAPAGSTINASIYRMWDNSLATALVNAKNRGVNVQLVMNNDAGDIVSGNPAWVTLSTGIGTNRANQSWIVLCTLNAACIGSAGSPINHNKFFLFSSTAGATNVVLQTSSNFSTGNYTDQYNNALQLVGNTTLYNAYRDYFFDLAAKVKNSNYYTTVTAGSAKAYFFPRAGSTSSTDTIYNALADNVTCPGNAVYGTSGGNTIIRVAMWSFTRTEVANELRNLANQNCWIDVVYHDLSSSVRSALSGHSRIKLYKLVATGDHMFVHSKYMAIEGTYAGVKDTKLVFTGSHNFSYSALRENDEALIKLTNFAIFDQYRSNFWLLRARGIAG